MSKSTTGSLTTETINELLNALNGTRGHAETPAPKKLGRPPNDPNRPSIDFKIEKGITLPPKHNLNERVYRYDLMEVGDSVLISSRPGSNSTSVSVSGYSKKTGKKFTTRTVEGGIRVWRIA